MPTHSKTAEEVRAELSERGISLKAWAEAHNFKPRTVEAILRGERKGYYGKGLEISVALGLKKSA